MSKGKYSLGYMLRKLLKNVTVQNKRIYLYFIIYTITATIYPFFAVYLPKLLLTVLTDSDLMSTKLVMYIVMAYFLAAGSIGFVKTYILQYAFPRITKLRIDYLRDMIDKIISIDYKYMEDASFFEKNSRAMEATNSDESGIEIVYHKLFETPATLLTILLLTIFIGRLNFLILLGLLANVGISLWIRRKVHQYQYSLKEPLAHSERKKKYYYNTTHDFAYGKDIRLYQLKDQILQNYTKDIEQYIGIQRKIKNKEFTLNFFDLLFFFISNGLTYGILVYKVVNGMSIGDFSMYITAVTSLTIFMKTASEQLGTIINEGQYVYDYYILIERDMGEQGGELAAVKDTLEIEFNHVSFKYPGTDRYILKDFSLTIHKGEKLAIVGVNGAGKSTIVKLMTGLFEVTEGEIRINKVPIKEYNKKELFSMFSVVFQDVNLLAFSVKENITCSLQETKEDKLWEILEKVGLRKKIESLPKKLNHSMLKVIDEDGVEFSGGESQKLVIARALYKEGNMVIMDEPTAALDALAEAEIYENFSELVKGKTAVYISHRLASTKFCDKIALIDGDGLKEYGSHEELMKLKGVYYNMFTTQGKYYQEGGEVYE